MAQPSVSAHVRRLEAELRTELFDRMKGRIALTPAGETLLPFARRILADVDAAAESSVPSAGSHGPHRARRDAQPRGDIGAAVLSRLPQRIPRHRPRDPPGRLGRAGGCGRRGSARCRACDPAGRHDVLETQALLREELVVAVARSHPLARRRTMGIADFVMFRS